MHSATVASIYNLRQKKYVFIGKNLSKQELTLTTYKPATKKHNKYFERKTNFSTD